MNNALMYYIIFATPNIAGLVKLKDALWEVFDGDICHRNHKKEQPSLFTEYDIKEVNVKNYAIEVRDLVKDKFQSRRVSWIQIEEYIIQNTMLKESHIINYILRPLIESGDVIKLGIVGPKNYKEDNYEFR